MADAYACRQVEPNEAGAQGNCAAGFVQVNPTLVVFQTDFPPVEAMTLALLAGFFSSLGGPEAVAVIIRALMRLIRSA